MISIGMSRLLWRTGVALIGIEQVQWRRTGVARKDIEKIVCKKSVQHPKL